VANINSTTIIYLLVVDRN